MENVCPIDGDVYKAICTVPTDIVYVCVYARARVCVTQFADV